MAASRLTVSSEIESASNKEKASISASRSAGAARIFFKQAFATSNPMRPGARRGASRSRGTTLSVTVFADEPRRFVPPREIEPPHSGDDFVNSEPARRPRRLVNQRPQFALQRPMVGFGAFAQPPHLVLWHAFDRKVQG